MNRRILPPLVAAFALAAWPAFANHHEKIVVNRPPPELKAGEDQAPPAREGYVWAPGYYTWTGSKYEMRKGHWVAERRGYRYVAPRWAQEAGSWTLYPEQWVKNEDDKEKTVAKDSAMPPIAERR